MDSTNQFIGQIALITYVVATVVIVNNVRRGKVAQTLLEKSIGPAALLLHAVSAYRVTVTDDGFALGFFPALSLTSAFIVLLMLILTARQPVEVLGVVLYPVAGVCAVLGVWLASGETRVDSSLQYHILTSLLAYGMLAFAALQSLVLSAQIHYIRTLQSNGFLQTLPPIETMERLLFQLIAAGFGLLTLSLATGFMFLEDLFAQQLAHKTLLSLLAWVVFGLLLVGRTLKGWRGKTALRWILTGFGLLILAYFGSKLVLELILGR